MKKFIFLTVLTLAFINVFADEVESSDASRDLAAYRAKKPTYLKENVDPQPSMVCKENEFLKTDGSCIRMRSIEGTSRKGNSI